MKMAVFIKRDFGFTIIFCIGMNLINGKNPYRYYGGNSDSGIANINGYFSYG